VTDHDEAADAAPTAATTAAPNAATTAEATPTGAKSATKAAPRWRRVTAWVLLVLGGLLLPVAGAATWTRNLLLNTDRYVNTVGPLARNQAVLDRVSTVLTDKLVHQLDAQARLDSKLPEVLDPVTKRVATRVNALIGLAVNAVVHSQQFQKVWDTANRVAHNQVRAMLTGTGPLSQDSSGRVDLDLSQALVDVRTRAQAAGIHAFDDLPLEKVQAKVTLFQSKALVHARGAVNALQVSSWVLVGLWIVCLLGSVALSVDRRKGWLRVGIAVSIAAAILGIGVVVGRHFYVDALAVREAGRAAITASFDIITRTPRKVIRGLFVVGLCIAFLAWFVGRRRGSLVADPTASTTPDVATA